MDEDIDTETLAKVHPNRRVFVKRAVGAAAFAAPFIASYDLTSLSSSVAHAQTSNMSDG
jgi:hypothetical protein